MRERSRSGEKLADEVLEGHGLVVVGRERHVAELRQEVAEGRRRFASGARSRIDPDAQREGVDEAADQRLDLPAVAVGDRRPHGEVALPRVAVEQRRERGEQGHVERRPRTARERLEVAHHVRREGEREQLALPRRHRRPRMVGRQIERRHGRELGAPPGPVGLQGRAGELAALRHREVRVLDRQLGERRRPAGREGVVEDRQLADHQAQGPAVRDDVVHGDHEPVLAGGDPEQQGAQQRAGGEVERPARLAPLQPDTLRGPRGIRQGGEVDQRQRPPGYRSRRQDHLDHLGIAGPEYGAQGLVPAHDLAQRRGQHRRPELAVEAQRAGDVVGRAARVHLLHEPEPLLGKGERRGVEIAGGGGRGCRHDRRRGLRIARSLEAAGEPRHGRRVEQHGRRQLHAPLPRHAEEHAARQQRVPAEIEEVVVDPDRRDLQNLGPDGGQPLLVRGARRLVARRHPARRRRRGGLGHRHRLLPAALDPLREPGHGRELEQGADRQLHAEPLRDPRQHAGGEQRVAAEIEEIVVDPDPLQPEHLGDHRHQGLFERRPRLAGRSGLLVRRRAELRQRLAVHLAVRRQRQLGEEDPARGDHVVRQRLAQRGAEEGRREAVRLHHVGDEPLAARRIRQGHHHGLAHPSVAGEPQGERGLDLPQLDAEAPHLHLVVDAAEEVEHAVPAASAARSPVRYSRAPGRAENGSGTKRSAVSSGRSR